MKKGEASSRCGRRLLSSLVFDRRPSKLPEGGGMHENLDNSLDVIQILRSFITTCPPVS